jgi:hypothetical protein
MRRREAAVSDVSDPEKKADKMSSKNIVPREINRVSSIAPKLLPVALIAA